MFNTKENEVAIQQWKNNVEKHMEELNKKNSTKNKYEDILQRCLEELCKDFNHATHFSLSNKPKISALMFGNNIYLDDRRALNYSYGQDIVTVRFYGNYKEPSFFLNFSPIESEHCKIFFQSFIDAEFLKIAFECEAYYNTHIYKKINNAFSKQQKECIINILEEKLKFKNINELQQITTLIKNELDLLHDIKL